MSNPNDPPWTVGKLLQWTTQWFNDRQVEGGRLAAELLLARAMNCRKIELYTRYDTEPTEEQRATFRELVKQAGEHVPIAYLLGTREFFSLEFEVTPAVLVPRPETEALVQRAIDLCKTEPSRTWNILDVGTGSGCIAIAIAKYATNTAIVGIDISSQALAIAAANALRHGVDSRVKLFEGDCVALPAGARPPGGFDLLVSNPPYIGQQTWINLPPHIRDHEPKIALTPPSGNGLEFYRRLAAEAPAVLSHAGRLLCEIGYDQRTAVLDLLASAGCWEYAGSHRNRTDPYDRVLEFILNA